MLTLHNQTAIFDLLAGHLGVYPLQPELIVVRGVECCKKCQTLHNEDVGLNDWLDLLGWYDSSPDNENRVFLCEKLIENLSIRMHWSVDQLAELVYAHELAHYFHYKLNPSEFRSYTSREGISTYVESFAQLCTHAYVRFVDPPALAHQRIFMELNTKQPEPYKYFLDHNLHKMAHGFIRDFFLTPVIGGPGPLLNTIEDLHVAYLNDELELMNLTADEKDLPRSEQSLGFPDAIKMVVNPQLFENIL
jgi:hypothetical protein